MVTDSGMHFSKLELVDGIFILDAQSLEILDDQLQQIENMKNLYSSTTTLMSFLRYCYSPRYVIIREYVISSDKFHMQHLFSDFDISPLWESKNDLFLTNNSLFYFINWWNIFKFYFMKSDLVFLNSYTLCLWIQYFLKSLLFC